MFTRRNNAQGPAGDRRRPDRRVLSRHLPRRAFSLIELMICIAIVSVMAAMVIPRYSNASSRYQSDAAARRLVADLEEARQAARAASATVSVSFDVTNGWYDINYPATGVAAASSRRMRLGAPPLSTKLSSVAFATTMPTTISFNGYGSPAGAGTVGLTAGGITRTVRVSATPGVVTIE